MTAKAVKTIKTAWLIAYVQSFADGRIRVQNLIKVQDRPVTVADIERIEANQSYEGCRACVVSVTKLGEVEQEEGGDD